MRRRERNGSPPLRIGRPSCSSGSTDNRDPGTGKGIRFLGGSATGFNSLPPVILALACWPLREPDAGCPPSRVLPS
jgi:hypothetical protein